LKKYQVTSFTLFCENM